MPDKPFLTDRRASNGAPIIGRFKLTATLSPGGTATARLVSFGNTPGDYFAQPDETYTLSDPHYRFFGMVDEYCWAQWESDSESWEMLSMEGCLVRHAKVYTAVTALGTGTVKLWRWNPDAGPAAEVDTGITITVRDFRNKSWAVNERIFIYYEPKSRSWYVLGSAGADITFFELTADLVYGTAPAADNAKVLEWTGTAYAATGATIRVFDWGVVPGTYGNWVGRAPAGSFAGYQGIATIGPSGRYEIIWMEEQAKWLKFKLNAQLKYNAASAAVTEIEHWDGRELPGGTITVYNSVTTTAGVYQFWGPTDAIGYAVYDDKEGKYKIVSLETQAKKISFTLASASAGTAGFTAGTATGATVNDWRDGRKFWAGTTRDIHDPQGLFVRALQGAKGEALWNEQYDSGNGGYIAVECQTKAGWIDFTMTALFVSTISSAATINRFGGSQQDVQDPGSAVAIYDDQNLFSGKPIGSKGRAIYDAKEDRYRVVAMLGFDPAYGGLKCTGAGVTGTAGLSLENLTFDSQTTISGMTRKTSTPHGLLVDKAGDYLFTFTASITELSPPAGTAIAGTGLANVQLYRSGSAMNNNPRSDTTLFSIGGTGIGAVLSVSHINSMRPGDYAHVKMGCYNDCVITAEFSAVYLGPTAGSPSPSNAALPPSATLYIPQSGSGEIPPSTLNHYYGG